MRPGGKREFAELGELRLLGDDVHLAAERCTAHEDGEWSLGDFDAIDVVGVEAMGETQPVAERAIHGLTAKTIQVALARTGTGTVVAVDDVVIGCDGTDIGDGAREAPETGVAQE